MMADNIEDQGEIQEILSSLIGQLCWSIRFGYGEELLLDIGRRVPYQNPHLKDKLHGEWMIGSRGSDWVITANDLIVISSSDTLISASEKLKDIVNGTLVTITFDVPSLGLTIAFDNDYTLSIVPNLSNEPDDLEYWEIIGNNGLFLTVGPKTSWRYQPPH